MLAKESEVIEAARRIIHHQDTFLRLYERESNMDGVIYIRKHMDRWEQRYYTREQQIEDLKLLKTNE